MKRKEFILTATTAAVAVIITPVILSKCSGKKHYDPLIMPDMLGQFCSEETIIGIGNSYRKENPAENTKAKLTELLLADDSGKKIPATDKTAVLELLEKKILKEFEAYQVLILTGWIITRTEARQCALFTLS